jgi:hypothetical protein
MHAPTISQVQQKLAASKVTEVAKYNTKLAANTGP